MKKIIVIAVASIALLANVASAQSYYPTPGTSAACVTISRDLSFGSRGTDVTTLQNFLVAQNYPGAGSWMVTGYFGAATQAAVRDFQSQNNLAQTGIVDASTRAVMGNCGGTYNSYNPFSYNNTYNYNNNSTPFYQYQYPYSNQYQNQYQNQYNYNTYPYTYGSVPVLSSLSPASAASGSSVTVFGTGFDSSSNTVYVGGTTLSGIGSYNGTSLTFTVPQTTAGTVSVSVGNSRGVSNALTLSVANGGYSPYGCGTYPYNYGNCGGCTYGTNCANLPLTLTYLSPNQGAIGTSVTVFGTGFSRTNNNSVNFGNGVIANLSSMDGSSLSFTVPSQLSGYGYQPIGLGTYNVSVTNGASGITSNALPFTITSLSQSGSTGSPTITNVSGPTTLAAGVTGVWSASVNTMNNTYTSISVRWGDENLYGAAAASPQTLSLQGTQTFTFSHSYGQAGMYTITFTISNGSGQQNTATATVTVTTGGTSTISLNYLSPQSGRVGTQVLLTGSGFSQYDNTVHFGNGGSMHVPSYNATTIYYTVPSYLTPCDVTSTGSGVACPMYAQQVTPGTYPIYVTSSQGTTNTLNFTVTQ